MFITILKYLSCVLYNIFWLVGFSLYVTYKTIKFDFNYRTDTTYLVYIQSLKFLNLFFLDKNFYSNILELSKNERVDSKLLMKNLIYKSVNEKLIENNKLSRTSI